MPYARGRRLVFELVELTLRFLSFCHHHCALCSSDACGNGDSFNVCFFEQGEWWEVWAALEELAGAAELEWTRCRPVRMFWDGPGYDENRRLEAHAPAVHWRGRIEQLALCDMVTPTVDVAGAGAVHADIDVATDLQLLVDFTCAATVNVDTSAAMRPRTWIRTSAAASRACGLAPAKILALLWRFLGMRAGVVLCAHGRDTFLGPLNLRSRDYRSAVGGVGQVRCMHLLVALVRILRNRVALAESGAAEWLLKGLQEQVRPAEQLAAGVVLEAAASVAASVDAEVVLGVAVAGVNCGSVCDPAG